jgi:3-methyladenine DNA glycosylase AlkD
VLTDKEVLQELKGLGNEQTRKTYKRHGVGDKQFGVSYSNLGKLQKKIKTDHDLAGKLWASGVHDAQILATMIADPGKMTAKETDTWSKSLSNYVLTDALSGLVSKTPLARKKAEQWSKSKEEWLGSAGWQILSGLASRDTELPDSFFLPYLDTIESDIHKRKNRVRHAMNGALISIGARNSSLQKKALAVAARIGRVEVDHGDTGCKTPDAANYMRKIVERKEQSQSKAAKA